MSNNSISLVVLAFACFVPFVFASSCAFEYESAFKILYRYNLTAIADKQFDYYREGSPLSFFYKFGLCSTVRDACVQESKGKEFFAVVQDISWSQVVDCHYLASNKTENMKFIPLDANRPEAGIAIEYDGGETIEDRKSVFRIELWCSPDPRTAGIITFDFDEEIHDATTTTYVVSARTTHACPSSDKKSFYILLGVSSGVAAAIIVTIVAGITLLGVAACIRARRKTDHERYDTINDQVTTTEQSSVPTVHLTVEARETNSLLSH